ncbi:hypothetical protein YC2023_109944 [Brassica napus]
MRGMYWWLTLQWSNREEDETSIGEVETTKNNTKVRDSSFSVSSEEGSLMRGMYWWLTLQWSNREEDETSIGEVETTKNNTKVRDSSFSLSLLNLSSGFEMDIKKEEALVAAEVKDADDEVDYDDDYYGESDGESGDPLSSDEEESRREDLLG